MLVSVRIKQFEVCPPILSALILICPSLSSPETYKILAGIFNATCKSKVDFPIPGCPPIKTKEPLTIPPPSTRLSSPSGVTNLGRLLATISGRAIGFGFLLFPPPPFQANFFSS
jgi:hypothetical protein